MTNSPETPAEAPSPAENGALDTATFQGIPQPRGEGIAPDDGSWHQLAKRYLTLQLISTTMWIALIAVAAVVITGLTQVAWVWIPAGILLVILLITLPIIPRQVRAFGYRLREDDLVLRRGILFQRVVAVPYGRMQLIDITHGPLDRAFGIAQLKLVTAAATSAVVLPGLTQAAAEQLRDTLIAVAETRRTGL
ncbi:PH domain-containing protein [Microbacterium sp. cx-59]|uniref:PH domain-containing protein n=1 Tax=Microbacterium sp. cx-59 TaxID=2891207 RepID=UPI001E4C8533|nr:PH domain-containing protein [Microbacterium sp. cx-59]MCC4908439.1 PH domain-containing protein [Microbacterium sp. cx-59]